MELAKMLFLALLTLAGVTVGIFFIGTFLISLMGITFALTFQHAIGVMVALLCVKYLVLFLVPPAKEVNSVQLQNENNYLKDTNLGLTMILGAIIKYHGGEIQIPTNMVSQITENVEVTHTSDYEHSLEVFTVTDEGDEKIVDSTLN